MIYCPRCEKPLTGHDDGACRRKMSRRWFLGALGGAAAAIVAKKRVPTGGLFNPKADIFSQFHHRYGVTAAEAIARGIDQQCMELWPTPKAGDIIKIDSVNVVNPLYRVEEKWQQRGDGTYRSVNGAPYVKTPFALLPFTEIRPLKIPW